MDVKLFHKIKRAHNGFVAGWIRNWTQNKKPIGLSTGVYFQFITLSEWAHNLDHTFAHFETDANMRCGKPEENNVSFEKYV